jgi:histone acetyltransferase (RNA polymerase elongator complex component)
VAIELDVLTFDDLALRASGRRYRSALVLEQLAGLPELGLGVGIVLAPGLPGTSHASAVRDAEVAASRVGFARIHPVLVLVESGLRTSHMDGTYTALTVGQAVTTSRAMLEVFEQHGVPVIRIGQNPAADDLGRAVAGPIHAPLRQLVDGRRFLDRLRPRLCALPMGTAAVVRCHPADQTAIRGPMNQHVRSLRAEGELSELTIRPDPDLQRGELAIDEEGP